MKSLYRASDHCITLSKSLSFIKQSSFVWVLFHNFVSLANFFNSTRESCLYIIDIDNKKNGEVRGYEGEEEEKRGLERKMGWRKGVRKNGGV